MRLAACCTIWPKPSTPTCSTLPRWAAWRRINTCGLDRFTVRNLELVQAQHPGGVPLIDILDQTITPMGARLLRKWIVLPLKEVSQIQRRLDTVAALLADSELLEEVQGHLRPINDLERLIGKVAVRRVNPRELLQLARALESIAPLREKLAGLRHQSPRKAGRPAQRLRHAAHRNSSQNPA